MKLHLGAIALVSIIACRQPARPAFLIGPAPSSVPAWIPDRWMGACYGLVASYGFARRCATLPQRELLDARARLQPVIEQLRAAELGIPTGQAYDLSLLCDRDRATLTTALATARCALPELDGP